MIHILYNRLAANGRGYDRAQPLRELCAGKQSVFHEMDEIEDLQNYFDGLVADDTVIIAGGDGTLNRMVNRIEDREYVFPIYFYPAGSGNDFFHDMQGEADHGLILINGLIRELPSVTVDGRTHLFLNGVGYGIDGYCCEVGDRKRQRQPEKPVNYTAIAILGLLFHYKPTGARVTVDGVTHTYKRVWLAPTMHGRYYGGGMQVAPAQDRRAADGQLSLVVMHGTGKLKTLCVFPSIFKGEHVRHDEMVEVLTGHDIRVEFDRPTALQIDGETIVGVTAYEAHGRPKTAQSTAAAEVIAERLSVAENIATSSVGASV